MGNDGGSIPTRRELVKEAARNPSTTQVKEAQREQLEHHWTSCPLSHKPLTRPIVSDSAGNLYNKDAILKFLIPSEEVEGISSKADCEEILQGRVKGLRDVVELKLEVDTEHTATGTAGNNNNNNNINNNNNGNGKMSERWICPITTKQLGPSVKSVYLVPCGHVFSEEAIREMKGDKCLQCNEEYTDDNIIPILSTKEADNQRLLSRVQKLAEQGLSHSLKKASNSKKRKKHANGESTPTPVDTPPSRSQTPGTGTQLPVVSSAGIKNAATAMLTARVLEEENEKKKRRKRVGANENLQSLFTDGSNKEKNGDFMTRGYTIPRK
jgi:hypothetical protein